MAPTTTGCRTRCYVGATRVVEETDDCDSHGNRVHARTLYQKRTREHDDRLQLRDCGRGDRVKSEKLLRVLSSIYVHTLSRRPYARARLRPRVLVRGRVPRAFRTERIFSLRRAHARQLLSRCILNNVAAAAYCLALRTRQPAVARRDYLVACVTIVYMYLRVFVIVWRVGYVRAYAILSCML